MYPKESIKSQPGNNLYIQSDGGATNLISGNGAYAQMLARKADGTDGANLIVGPNYVSSKADSFNINGTFCIGSTCIREEQLKKIA